MYQPSFNSILVELQADEWGGGNDDSMMGKSYREGVVVALGGFMPTNDYPLSADGMNAAHELVKRMTGKHIMFNEGVEAGTVHEHEGKVYGFIYWWDVRGVKDEQ